MVRILESPSSYRSHHWTVNNLSAADQIVVLEDGTTVEKGTPVELLSNPNSRLARYVDQLHHEEEKAKAEGGEMETIESAEESKEDEGRDQELIVNQNVKRWAVYQFWAHHSGYLNTLVFVICTIVLSGPYLLPQVSLSVDTFAA